MAGQRNPATLTYLWGWNAVASVAGSALAASLALWLSFGAGMYAGAGCYLVVALAALAQSKRG
jgi:hypothetical protein